MAIKRFFIYFIIMLATVYPVASAAEVSLNRWVLNITLHDDGTVEDVIQAEIMNSGSLPLDGFSFVVPGSDITMIYDFGHTQSFTGQTVEEQILADGKSTNIIVHFNSSVEAGNKWDGRIGFTAQNWVIKDGSNYSIDIPVVAPQAIVAGKSIDIQVPNDTEIRGQAFLPTGVEVVSVTPKPFKVLFQFDHMVPTWTPETLHSGDVIHIKGSFSNILNKIVGTDERLNALKIQINKAKAQGINVDNATVHLKNAENYNTNQALQSYWINDYNTAVQYVGYANDELNLTENSLSTPTETVSPEETAGKKSPGFGMMIWIIAILLIYLSIKRR